jgi:hypothetical protein
VNNRIVLLSVSSGWMDVLASGMTGSVVGGPVQGLIQLLGLCGHRQSVSHLSTLPVVVKSLLDVSPDGDDTTWPWHLQDQVGIMWDHHELGECQLSQESIVRSLKISNLKLYSLRAEIFPSPKGYGKSDLTNGGCCCTRDYAMERNTTGAQQRPG